MSADESNADTASPEHKGDVAEGVAGGVAAGVTGGVAAGVAVGVAATLIQHDGEDYRLEPTSPDHPRASDFQHSLAPLPEVTYDEHGQTWDVYGAQFDPEVLGDAIVKHLEKLMETKEKEDPLWRREENPRCEQQANGTAAMMRWLCFYSGRR